MYQQRIVIVGAGIVGLSTAYALLSQGMKRVTVLEQETVDHRRATSHGSSRLLRFEYGYDTFYSEMVMVSLSRWLHLERITKRTLYKRTGLLVLGKEEDSFTLPSYQALRGLGLPVERLTEQHCRERFPQFATQAFDRITYNIEAGILHASASLHALKELVLDMGGEICEASRVTAVISDSQRQPVRLRLRNGDEVRAERVVLATGPWVHRLLADLHLPVRLTRQYLFYFGGLPIGSFGVNRFPAFLADELYGFPIHSTYKGRESLWLKAASHIPGPLVDPDEDSVLNEQSVARVLVELEALIPALRHAVLAHIDPCIYDLTPDENFIIDTLPHDTRVVFATGLSGHGFKFGLLLGELLSSMVCDTEPIVSTGRFRLARFASSQRREESQVAYADNWRNTA
ncbi:MAG: FAD-dependent oxidoreductase [Ktedonobacteraceae bacterium]|nr:FAD-dependent oxidoreductase [Ktedonobacteraceae bacterium]